MPKKVSQALLLGMFFFLGSTAMGLAETSATPALLAQATPSASPAATPAASPSPASAPASTSASPVATATPLPLTYGGFLRGYYFTRTNASPYGLPQTTNVLNQASFNEGISAHADYEFASHWHVGGTYLFASPFNNCTDASDQVQVGGPCSGKTATFKSGGTSYLYSPVPTNPDNTLPGFELNTLYEAYLEYQDANLYGKIGNQLFTSPWANAADTRIKPEAFQGGDIAYKFNTNWTGELAFMDRFESRVDSAFVNSTLLTATNMADAPGAGANLLIPKYSAITTSGFGYGRGTFTEGPFTGDLYLYDFVDIAAAEWFDAKYNLPWPGQHAYVALQAGNEGNIGRGVIGKINSQVVGMQGGITPVKNIDLTLGFDYIPEKTDTITLPSNVTCQPVPSQPPAKTPAGNQIAVTGTVPFEYFLPTGGTPNCINNSNGTATIYYGGWASPYTDSYTSDPLFTTSMTGGMVERRSPGTSGKVAATLWGDDRQIRLITSYAIFAFGNNTTGVSPQQEVVIDGTYYFSKVPKTGPYHGLSLRHRYANRDIGYTTYYGGLPVYKYNRTQLEYDF